MQLSRPVEIQCTGNYSIVSASFQTYTHCTGTIPVVCHVRVREPVVVCHVWVRQPVVMCHVWVREPTAVCHVWVREPTAVSHV